MESFSKDTEEYTEDIPGKKKSKLKNLKTRIFGKTKKLEVGRSHSRKLSQSASDITPEDEEGLGSEEDLVCSSQGMLGSRALSHDSIFMADDVLAEPQLANAQSQENVHSKIKALQMKLQQQKMHLGPPPAIVPIKHPEDSGSRSEDDGLPHSPSETSVGDIITTGTSSKVTSQTTSRLPKATLIKSVPAAPPSRAAPLMDFSSPAQFTPILDTSAARHRMSVKPRNQRASAKGKGRLTATDCKPPNNTNRHSMSEKDEEQQLAAHDETTQLPSDPAQTLGSEKEQINITTSSQCPPSKSAEPLFIITPRPGADTQEAPKYVPHRLAQQDHTVPGGAVAVTAGGTTKPLGDKPHRPADALLASQQSQSSSVHPDKQEQSVGPKDFETQAPASNGPVSCPTDQLSTGLSSMGASRFKVQSQREVLVSTTGVLQRPRPISGSFRFSGIAAKGQDGERPRSGSVKLGVLEKDRARLKIGDGAEFKLSPSNMNQREKELQKEGPTTVGTPWQGEALCKGPIPQDRKDNLKKGEPVKPSKQTAVDADAVEKEEVTCREEEGVENALETKEDPEGEEGKSAFGVTLRSTSLSLKFRSDVASTPSDSRVKRYSAEMGSLAPPIVPSYNRPTKSVLSDQHYGINSKARENLGDNDTSPASAKLSTNNPCAPAGSLRQTDGIPSQSGSSALPVKGTIQTPATADPHTTPAVTSEEVQTISSKPKEDPETVPQSSPDVSWMSMAMEKTRSIQQLLTSRLPRDFTSTQQATSQSQAKPANQAQTVTQSQQAPNITQQAQTTTVKEQHSSPQQAQPLQSSLTQSTLSSSQPPTTKSNLVGLRSATQPRPSASAQALVSGFCYTPSTTAAPASTPASGRGFVFQGKGEELSLSERRPGFLQKQTELTTPSGNKVELRKPQTEAIRTPAKSLPIPITTTSNKDPEEKPGVRLQESSPSKVPGRLADNEDKWLRKQISSSSLTSSSSPTQSSPLQSLSNSGQPSWMEMAKRKSMAWSDKSMD